jgi:hypothetical protein
MKRKKLMKQEAALLTPKSHSKDYNGVLEKLPDDQIDKLVSDHWREIKGLLNEMRKRRRENLSNTDGKPLGARSRDGRPA